MYIVQKKCLGCYGDHYLVIYNENRFSKDILYHYFSVKVVTNLCTCAIEGSDLISVIFGLLKLLEPSAFV